MKALDDANSGKRFRQSAADLGLQGCGLAEERAQALEALFGNQAKQRGRDHGGSRQRYADAQQIDQCQKCGNQPADKLNERITHQVASAFHVADDAGGERSSFVRVEVSHGQPEHVLLHFPSQLRHDPMALSGDDLRHGKRTSGLQKAGGQNAEHQRTQEGGLAF
jgi:hypothetical protein